MKLTTFILLISLMQVSAATFGQRVTLKQNNLTIDKVFREIRKQTGYDVLMGYGDFKASKINANFDNAPLTEVMDVVVKNTGLTYSIEEKTIVIKRKEKSFIDKISDRLNVIDVSGQVVDVDGRTLAGASVLVKGTGKAVSTNLTGNFYLSDVNEDAVLVISFIGYVTKEVKVTKNIGVVVLELSNSKLDEVQVIAYGTTTKRLTTSNIGTIKASEIAQQPVSNPLLALQGRIPGIQISQNSGVAGSGIKVRIQGQNSIANGNEPFYVIDGVPYQSQGLYNGISDGAFPAGADGQGSNLSFIDPSTIESVEFLKDADATAIYGSRAANGAILITTKKGKAGKTKIELNMQSGVGTVTRKLKLMNTEQYLNMRREALKNDNDAQPGISDYDLNGAWDQTRDVNWQKELLGGDAHYTNVKASISGGSQQTQFLAGGGYNRETSVFSGNFNDTKASAHFSLNNISTNQKFRFDLRANYLQDDNQLPTLDLTSLAIALPPNAPSLYKEDGSINWQIVDGKPTFLINPATSLARKYRAKTTNLIGNSILSYELFKNLVLKSNFSYNQLQSDELNTTPQSSFTPTSTRNSRKARYGNKSINTWLIEPQMTFKQQFRFGVIDALLGSSFQKTASSVKGFNGSLYANDTQLENPLAAGALTPNPNTRETVYKYNAVFARVNYRYNERYILNASVRRDGSSRFGSENLFNNFFSVGGAWLFGEEPLFKKHLGFINYGKLRLTYGTTGNDQISDYQFLNLYQNYVSNVAVPYQGITGLLPTGLSNPYLQWEETRKLNFGLDLEFLKSRLLFSTNYYKNRSSNQLLQYDLPWTSGFNYLVGNRPATVQNSGWEFLIDASLFKNKHFNWLASFNLTLPKNELIAYPDLENSAYRYSLTIGKPITINKLLSFAGVNPQTGLYQYTNKEGQLTSNPDLLADQIITIDMAQKFYGGFSNTLTYKGFEVNFLLQFVKQKARNYRFGSSFPGWFGANEPVTNLNRWSQVGDVTSVQRVSTAFDESAFSFNAALLSDASYTDGSFIRLKNASIAYSLPDALARRITVSNAKVYFSGQNLLTITKLDGVDPESVYGVLPPLRVFSLGLQLTF